MQQRVAHRGGCLPALCRILCKRAIDDFADGLREVRRALSERHGRLFEDGADGVVDAAALARDVERERAGNKL